MTTKVGETNGELSFLGKWALYAGPVLLMLARYAAMWAAAKLPDWAPAELKSEAFWFGLIVAILVSVVGAVLTARRKKLERDAKNGTTPTPGTLAGTLRLLMLLPVAGLMCGCGTFRMTPTQGINGPDGAMLTCSWGHNPRQALCAADPDQIPAGTYEAAPERRTWVGRAMVKVGNGLSTGVKATADWTAEHPFLAGSIAAIGAGVAIGAKNDWWGIFGGDDDGDKKDAAPDVAPAGSDREIDAKIAGSGNALNVSYTYVPGGGKMPNVAADVNGDNNRLNIDVKPLE